MTHTFETLIAYNKRMSWVLVSCLTLVTALLSAALYYAYYVYRDNSLSYDLIGQAAALGACLTIVGALISYYYGNTLLRTMHGAITVGKHNDKTLYNVVEEMAIAAGIPMPAIFAVKDDSPNAFASGRDPEHAFIGITTGLRKKLTRDELQAVVAHEIAHIKNYDTRLMMLVAVFAGIIVLICDFYRRRFVDAFTTKLIHKRRANGLQPISPIRGAFYGLIAMLVAWIAPLLARLMQLAISREREYLADATAVQLCRNPEALISALEKIATDPEVLYDDNRATEHLYIVNPNPALRLQHPNQDSIWCTHPPLIMRIQRIKKLVTS